MTEPVRDQWAQWLLERRFGGDPGQREKHLGYLIPWRDRILENAAVQRGETFRDVGQQRNRYRAPRGIGREVLLARKHGTL